MNLRHLRWLAPLAVVATLCFSGAGSSAPLAAPTNTGLPIVTDAQGHNPPRVGDSLIATTGSWNGSPTSFKYQFLRCNNATDATKCANAGPNSASNSYTLAGAEKGKYMRVTVTATNAGGSTQATSAATAAVTQTPTNTAPPVVSDTSGNNPPQVGDPLTTTNGTWTNSPTGYAYQWLSCDSSGANCTPVAGATHSSYTTVSGDIGHALRSRVTASNSSGSDTADSAATPAVVASTPSPVVAAAGDIACDPKDPQFNGGNGSALNFCKQKATSDLLVNGGYTAVLPLGDDQYDCGGAAAFTQSYDPSWGRVKATSRPAAGNHEYETSAQDPNSTDCGTGDASGYFTYFGAAAGPNGKGWYSYDIGNWHLVVLNSECAKIGGCGPGSPQDEWLKYDLATHTNTCTLAYWHRPLFTSGTSGGASLTRPFWQDLYSAGAELVLNGHDHLYERFASQTPTGAANSSLGIREFIVGTGGKTHGAWAATIAANSLVRDNATYGVLQLALRSGSYVWQFIPMAGQTFTDSGSDSCHSPVSDSTHPPTNTLLPAIADAQGHDVPLIGDTVTASNGLWSSPATYTYQWRRCTSATDATKCTDITGAESASYTAVSADNNFYLRVVVTATNAKGSGKATAYPTKAVAPVPNPPSPTVLPVITDLQGNSPPQVGDTLNATTGTWNGDPISYAYQWRSCSSATDPATCSDIAGATLASYTPAQADLGLYLRVDVTATNAGGLGDALSNATGAVAPIPNSGSDTFTRTVAGGWGRADSGGTWVVQPGGSASKQSVDGQEAVLTSPAASTSYEMTLPISVADVDVTNRVRVSAVPTGATDSVSTEARFQDVNNLYRLVLRFQTTGNVDLVINSVVGGVSSQVGSTVTNALTAVPANTWVRVRFQVLGSTLRGKVWLDGSPEPSTWTITASDSQITAAGAVGVRDLPNTGSTTPPNVQWDDFNAGPAAATAPPTNTTPPAITDLQGNSPPQVGDTLNATTGTWNGDPISYAYQWRICTSQSDAGSCTDIGGATSSSYTVAPGDLGNYLRVVVTARNDGGPASAISDATAAVAPQGPTNTVPPTISDAQGNSPPQVGDTLNASNGTWTSSPTSFAYQWRSCDPGGASCGDITGANQSTYTVASGDVGHTLVVHVTATNVSGSSSADSAATAPVVSSGSPTVYALDSFTRTVAAGGWGTANFGGNWVVQPGGSASKQSVDGQEAVLTSPAASTSYEMTLPISVADVDVTNRVRVSAVPTGATDSVSTELRFQDVNNLYRLVLRFQTTGNVDLVINSVVGGTSATLATTTGVLTGVPGNTWVRVRFQAIGTTLRGKIWLDGNPEPANWAITATNSSITAAGAVGVRDFPNSGSTTPPNVQWDDFSAVQAAP
jgi:hypothetical protein